ncbi:MAG: 30S ribosome-binding factor RbfA [Elusimicrobia bacterium]|nr:30S ribosome-binding factor RbfA [Elusimicrobiota bacterium]
MRKKSIRSEKVSSVLIKALGDIIIEEVSDPSMGVVTLTGIDLSNDLRIAKVYFTVRGGTKEFSKQVNIIKNLEKFLRRRLASRVVLKYVPEVRLYYDELPAQAHKIDMILEKIKDERAQKDAKQDSQE